MTNEFAERYMSAWNEADPEARRKLIAGLWTEDAVVLLDPPQVVRETAADLGVAPVLEVRGHDALEHRVTRAYDAFVAPGEVYFAVRTPAVRLGDVVTFSWSVIRTDDGTALGGGLEVCEMAADGRIRKGYQFIDR